MSTHELFAISMGCQGGVEGCRGKGTVERMLRGFPVGLHRVPRRDKEMSKGTIQMPQIHKAFKFVRLESQEDPNLTKNLNTL